MLHNTITLPLAVAASEDLYLAARATLIANGTSLAAWCRANSVSRQTMEKALKGEREGKRSRHLREQLIAELFSQGRTA